MQQDLFMLDYKYSSNLFHQHQQTIRHEMKNFQVILAFARDLYIAPSLDPSPVICLDKISQN